MGLKHDCFFCTLSIVRYSDRNVKNMFHIAKCCYVSACGCFTFMSCYRFIYHKSLHINVYRDLSQLNGWLFCLEGEFMKEPSCYQMHRLKITDWEDAPHEYNYWGAGDPMEIDKGDLQHMMKGFLLNYSDDGEYGHYLRLSKDAVEWLKGLTDVSD